MGERSQGTNPFTRESASRKMVLGERPSPS